MKVDLSRKLYNKYFNLTDKTIEITMKNGAIFRGVIIGFYRSEDSNHIPCITQWHIVEEQDVTHLGRYILGFMTGNLVKTNAIAEVKFLQDNTVLNFQ